MVAETLAVRNGSSVVLRGGQGGTSHLAGLTPPHRHYEDPSRGHNLR